VREVLDAYTFTLIGTEVLNGRTTLGDRGHARCRASRASGGNRKCCLNQPRFWIDQQDYSWTKLRAEFTDTVVIRLGSGALAQGFAIRSAQVRVNDEVWLPQRIDVKLTREWRC